MANNPAPAQSPYPGAQSMYSEPVPAAHRQILTWGIDGATALNSGLFTASGGQFITDGLSPGDPLVIVASNPTEVFATTVFSVEDEQTLFINYLATQNLISCWYKAGAGAIHTLQTLLAQLKVLGIGTTTIRWGHIWASVPSPAYNPGTDGSLITI